MIKQLQRHWITSRLGRSGTYLEVNGKSLYFEVYGKGEPVLFFHGGLSTLCTFRFQIPDLSRHFQLILPERPGNGHTADIPEDYSYEAMADDMAAFIEKLGIEDAKLLGYSDGANLIIPLALRYPHLVNRFISVGGNFHYEGCLPIEMEYEMNLASAEGAKDQCPDEDYARWSPDGPQHYPVVFKKTCKLWKTEPVYQASDLHQIQAKGLILAGDEDCISLEHTTAFYRALPKANLGIIPGATHRLLKEKPAIVNPMILDFLREEDNDEE